MAVRSRVNAFARACARDVSLKGVQETRALASAKKRQRVQRHAHLQPVTCMAERRTPQASPSDLAF